MCGIIGYTGIKEARKILLDGLKSLEYRGYDSAGIATAGPTGIPCVVKCGGNVDGLIRLSEQSVNRDTCGIGHTRWATHGAPTAENAHPHCSRRVTLVHNGIIDNCLPLREMLKEDGYVFTSETDTEAVAHLIDREYGKSNDPVRAIYDAIALLAGSFALAILFSDRAGEIYAVRRDNPLILASAEDGCYLSSDIPALLTHTRAVYRPGENVVLRVTKYGMSEISAGGEEKSVVTEQIDWNVGTADKEGYPTFMLKEINEQPSAVRRCITHRLNADGLPDFTPDLVGDGFFRSFDSICIISCGSATHAGLVGRYLIEKLAGVPVTVNTASEYRYGPPATVGRTLALAISQSGETADTLAALRLAKENGLATAAIINVYGSAIAREADCVFYTNAGPEIAVATTKGYATQTAVLALMALKIAYARGRLTEDEARALCQNLAIEVPDAIASVIARQNEIRAIAERICQAKDLYFIGRGPDCQAGAECSLKMKEITYVHSESYAAGELKHGTLSLIEEGTPVVALASDPLYFDKMNGNIREVRSRGGQIVLIAAETFDHPEKFSDFSFLLPPVDPLFSPLVTVAVSQLLAYETAILRGCDVDHPRNLAKSVTVE